MTVLLKPCVPVVVSVQECRVDGLERLIVENFQLYDRGQEEWPMAATVNPREDMPMADSMSHFDDIVIVSLDRDREFFRHDSFLSYRVRRDC
jgi:hypothetical protein